MVFWSFRNPWIFQSLSGLRILIHDVEEKKAISSALMGTLLGRRKTLNSKYARESITLVAYFIGFEGK